MLKFKNYLIIITSTILIIFSGCTNTNSSKMIENEYGGIVRACWNDLPEHYTHILLDEFIVMPNHVHGIIVIRVPVDMRHGLTEIVRAFKTFSSRRINETGRSFKWQRNFHDHIIRDNAK